MYTANFVIPCGLQECEPCIDCDTANLANYEINWNLLCFSFNNSNNKYEAVLPNTFECNGKNYLIKTMNIVSNNTGCSFTIEKRNGFFYLQYTGTCTQLTGNLILEFCWNDC